MIQQRPVSSHGTDKLSDVSGIASQPGKAMYRSKRHDSIASSGALSGILATQASSTTQPVGIGGSKVGLVPESAESLRKRSRAAIGASVHQSISKVSYVDLLEWIRSERLTTVPHEGDSWDRVLIRALHFAEQLHKFEQSIQHFAIDSSEAAAIGYGHAQLLLELGQKNSEALYRAFSVFYKFEGSFSSVLHSTELLAVTPAISGQLCLLYTDLLSLVVDVSIRFYKIVNGTTSGSTSLDMFEAFGDSIESFRTRQRSVVEWIWVNQINERVDEADALDVNILNRWLAPQDRVIESLSRDHSTYVDQQAEFTCLWFQTPFINFICSGSKSLLVTAPAGGGKTTLAGSIVERLQRPINRKQYDILFCSLSPDIPTTTTSIAVAKSLLFQLLNTRVGNMDMYMALVHAYHQCRSSSDLKTYEENLWQALANILKQSTDGSNELVMIVDGLDEIAESQSASIQSIGAVDPATLLDKLTSITNANRGVRLITFSTSLKLPEKAEGVHYKVSGSDVRGDLHAVARRALDHNHHFIGQKGYSQEAKIDQLIRTAEGSFLWTILACQTINVQKSPDAVTKTLQNLQSKKPSVQDLVLGLYSTLDITSE
jgi:Cdc6-like AAA superfamily ATPase